MAVLSLASVFCSSLSLREAISEYYAQKLRLGRAQPAAEQILKKFSLEGYSLEFFCLQQRINTLFVYGCVTVSALVLSLNVLNVAAVADEDLVCRLRAAASKPPAESSYVLFYLLVLGLLAAAVLLPVAFYQIPSKAFAVQDQPISQRSLESIGGSFLRMKSNLIKQSFSSKPSFVAEPAMNKDDLAFLYGSNCLLSQDALSILITDEDKPQHQLLINSSEQERVVERR